MNYHFRELNLEDIKAIDSLFSKVFNYRSNTRLLKWKYFENPYGHAVLIGAFHGKKLVASGAMIPEKINLLGEKKIVYKCTDLMTHPSHQRRSLSTKVNSLLLEHKKIKSSAFTYTLCSKLATKSFLKNNWKHLDSIYNYFKPALFIKVSSFLPSNKLQSIEFYDSMQNTLDNFKFENNSSNISVNKSCKFIKWRIANPNFTYKLICHRNEENEIDGYLIYSISSNNVLSVIDLDSGGEMDVLNKLVRGAESVVLKEKYKAIVVFGLPRSTLGKFFKSKRYLGNPFQKGPLKSLLDLNFLSQAHKEDLSKIDLWDIYALSYDDI